MRFRRRIKLAPGVTLNVGKKSVGVRVGGRGFGVSTNTRSGTRASAGIPGTGISYSQKIGGLSSSKAGDFTRGIGGAKGCIVPLVAATSIISAIGLMLAHA